MREGFIPRTTGAVLLALLLVASLFLALSPAEAAGNPYSEYEFHFLNGQVLAGSTQGSQGFEVPVFNTGYTVHVSCSTVYDDGWSNTGGFPNPTDHPDWEIGSYHIDRFKGDGSFHYSCEQPWDTTTTTEQDTTTTTEQDTTTTTEQDTTTTTEQDTTTTTEQDTTTTTEQDTTTTTEQDTTTTTEQDTTTTTEQDTTTTDVSVLAVQITTSSVSSETLPFTGAGFGEGGAVGIALAMLALGGMALLAVRRREEDVETVATGWSSRLWDVE